MWIWTNPLPVGSSVDLAPEPKCFGALRSNLDQQATCLAVVASQAVPLRGKVKGIKRCFREVEFTRFHRVPPKCIDDRMVFLFQRKATPHADQSAGMKRKTLSNHSVSVSPWSPFSGEIPSKKGNIGQTADSPKRSRHQHRRKIGN